MITVDQFYWVIFHTLLKPVGLDCRYFYPFGTVKNFIEFEYSAHPFIVPERACLLPLNVRHRSHVMFHFDQEPIYEDSDQIIFHGTQGNHLLRTRILANSEISDLKRMFCKKYKLLDWYFFYHGFAALHWYQDMVYIQYDEGFSHAFLSLNHLVRDRRSYRMSLTAKLMQKNILSAGLVSFYGTKTDCENELANENSLLSSADKTLIDNFLIGSDLPLKIDDNLVDSTFSARMGHHEYRTRQKGFFHVVNETIFYDKKLHLTEKIFQPIVVMRPFILVGAPGNLAYLKTYGFKTFSDWIDESYDTIADPRDRLDAITNILTDLAGRSKSYLDSMWQDMRPVLEHNKRHFFTDFRRIIVDEMVDNFDTCIRIWNNGRVDGRELPRHPDLAEAKRILLR